VNCCSRRRRSCAVHRRIKWSPTIAVNVKSAPLSCISTRRATTAEYERHPPWTCTECSSTQRHGPPLTAEVRRVTRGEDRAYAGCGCADDSESGSGLLYDETYTSRRTLRQSQSLPRSSSQPQHHTGGTSPSRTVLLLGAD